MRGRVISVKLGQYYGCWCPGSLRRQDISSDDIDYVECASPGLTWGRILSTCVISMWSNDIKCKYMFMPPLKTLARNTCVLKIMCGRTALIYFYARNTCVLKMMWGRTALIHFSNVHHTNIMTWKDSSHHYPLVRRIHWIHIKKDQ